MDYAQRPGIPGNRRNFDARTGFEQPSQSAPTKPDPENVPPSQLDFDDPGIPAQAQKDDQVQLSEEQQNVLEAVKQGKNVFFTGPAGQCLSTHLHWSELVTDLCRWGLEKVPESR